MIDIEKWMEKYKENILAYFKNRVLFIGLQGSYARKEATEKSDIDVVLILDEVNIEDLEAYRNLIATLPHREFICGFVSGKAELACWCQHDLFQFYFDTVPVQGCLEDIIPPVTKENAQQAALIGACNIYHACSHNFLHGQQIETLKMLYKSSFFVMQAHYYCQTGQYAHSRAELQGIANEQDSQILEILQNFDVVEQDDLKKYTQMLLKWAEIHIKEYKVQS